MLRLWSRAYKRKLQSKTHWEKRPEHPCSARPLTTLNCCRGCWRRSNTQTCKFRSLMGFVTNACGNHRTTSSLARNSSKSTSSTVSIWPSRSNATFLTTSLSKRAKTLTILTSSPNFSRLLLVFNTFSSLRLPRTLKQLSHANRKWISSSNPFRKKYS